MAKKKSNVTEEVAKQAAIDALQILNENIETEEHGVVNISANMMTVEDHIKSYTDYLADIRRINVDAIRNSNVLDLQDPVVAWVMENRKSAYTESDGKQKPNAAEIVSRMTVKIYKEWLSEANGDAVVLALMTQNQFDFTPTEYTPPKQFTLPGLPEKSMPKFREENDPLEIRIRQIYDVFNSNPSIFYRVNEAIENITIKIQLRAEELESANFRSSTNGAVETAGDGPAS